MNQQKITKQKFIKNDKNKLDTNKLDTNKLDTNKLDINKSIKLSDTEEKIYGYNFKTDSWHCMICSIDMGNSNPRQLCGKTFCYKC